MAEMKKFDSDSPVCHPMYGLGQVKTVEEKTVLGEKISIAKIFFPNEDLELMVNIEKQTDLFRPLIEMEQVDAVFEHLESHEMNGPNRANQRQRANLEKIKSNDIFLLCEVIKDLAIISGKKKLSFKESDMYERARRVLVEELALVTGWKSEAIDERIARACLSNN